MNMTELAQELDAPNDANLNPDNLPEESIDFGLLRLDSFKANNTTSANTPNTTTHCYTPCNACGCSGSSALATINSSSSNKRSSPDLTASKLDSQDQIPKRPKKLFPEPQENATLHDFSKITLPCASSGFGSGSTNPSDINTQTSTTNPIPFRRCHSDPYNPSVTGSDSLSGSGMGFASNLAPQSPPDNSKMVGETVVTTPASKTTASLPPRPRMLRRSASEPSPNKSFSRSSSCNDITADGSLHFKWLKRMKDSMKEMNQWWDELMPDVMMGEGEEGDKPNEDNIANAVKAGSEIECEEAVSVERTGECLVVRFKCPCGKGYQILLSGRDCYYKLM